MPNNTSVIMFKQYKCISRFAQQAGTIRASSATGIGATRWQSTATQPAQKNDNEVKSRQRDMTKKKKPSNSFVMNSFLGKANISEVFPYPIAITAEETETLQLLIPPTHRFFNELNDPVKNEDMEAVDEATLQHMRELGAFGMQVPTEYGGAGLTNTQYARLGEFPGYHDLGVSITMGAHQSIGFKAVLLCGNDEQKNKYLPTCASGEKLAAFCLTEPSSGSDASSIRSRAVLSADGTKYVLNGSKIWISNGGIADIFTVFAQTPVTNERGETRDKVSAFIVERSFPGVSSGPPEKKMGIKASNTTEVFFDNVEIPTENVVGGVGNGFKVAMEVLNNGRFGMAAALCGTMRYGIEKAVAHASSRVQFGRKINTFGAIQEKLARMAMNHYVTESLAFMISSNMDKGSKDYHLEAAVSKIFASEAAWNTTDEAIQVLGGMGYMKETGLEKVLRDLRIFRIFEGTNDILRLFVALTGLQYAGGHLKELQRAMKNPASNFGLILGEGTKRAKKAIGMSQVNSLEGVHPTMSDSGALVSKGIQAFGTTSENLLIKHGKNIIEQQFVLTRLANSVIDLYTSVVVLSRVSHTLNLGLPSAAHEEKLARVWVNEASDRILTNLALSNSTSAMKNYDDLAAISQELCENGEVLASRPLGI